MNTLTHCPHCGHSLVEPQETKPKADLSLEWQILAGVPKVYRSRGEEIKNALQKYFKLTPRWNSKFEREWLEWAVSIEDMNDETIECAAKVWRCDKLFNWAVPNLKGIADHWLELSSLEAGCWVELVERCANANLPLPCSKEEWYEMFQSAWAGAQAQLQAEAEAVTNAT